MVGLAFAEESHLPGHNTVYTACASGAGCEEHVALPNDCTVWC